MVLFSSSIHCKNGVTVRLSLKLCNPTETAVCNCSCRVWDISVSRVLFQVVCTEGTVFLYHTSFCNTQFFFFVRCRVRSSDEGNQFFSQGQWRLATSGFPLLHLCKGAKEAQKITEECGTSKFRWTKTTRGVLINPQDIFRTPSDFYCAFRLCIFILVSARIFSA